MPSRLHTHPPFHAEHVGSLLRPKELLEKRSQYESKQCTVEELKAAEDAAIAAVVKLQQENGMCTITDGEMRRQVFPLSPARLSLINYLNLTSFCQDILF